MFGRKSWVGYNSKFQITGYKLNLPKIKDGILSPLDNLNYTITDENTINRLNFLYAKDYSTTTDLGIIWKGIRNLGK